MMDGPYVLTGKSGSLYIKEMSPKGLATISETPFPLIQARNIISTDLLSDTSTVFTIDVSHLIKVCFNLDCFKV